MSETRARSGRQARQAERAQKGAGVGRPYIQRNIPTYDVLSEENLIRVEAAADRILAETGIEFRDDPEVLEMWRKAGAKVDGLLVKFEPGMLREILRSAPAEFTQHARNPANSVRIGGKNVVFSPAYGSPFVMDLDRGRRFGTLDDFQNFIKLAQSSPNFHHSGGTICEPTDIPVNKRHLDMLLAHMTLSDKPFMGSVTEPSRAADSVEMAKILFGSDFVDQNTVMTSLININSPMTFDGIMMGALEVYAKANQAAIVSPFIVGGAMAPVTVAGTLTQVLAEVLAGVAYSQLVRAGAPVIAGAFVTSIDMNSGAPTFGTPEASHITYGVGQLVRRLGLPYRSAGGFCGSKLPDAQAGYESANSLNMGLLSGVNFMLHACGWMEGGLVSSYEKFVMDADQLGTLHHLAQGIAVDENGQGMDAIREVGPGGHFLGCEHTQANFKTAFWRTDLFDYKPYETWAEEGARDTMALAGERVQKMLADYQAPHLDESIREGLEGYVARKKESMPDAFL